MSLYNVAAHSKCALETALKDYRSWASGTVEKLPLLCQKDYTEFNAKFKSEQNGRLLPEQQHKLMQIITNLMKPINRMFNRKFTASITPLVCGDAAVKMKDHNSDILLFRRKVRDQMLLAMFGGIADSGEDVSLTAKREFNEETGYGCKVLSHRLSLVRDFTLGGPLPRISVTYLGEGVGVPVSNHEASRFEYYSSEKISSLKEEQGFANHVSMLKKLIEVEHNPLQNRSIYYAGLDRPLSEVTKDEIRLKAIQKAKTAPSPCVDETITKIEAVIKRYTELFNEWQRDYLLLHPDFVESRDLIWSRCDAAVDKIAKREYEKRYNWNDFDRLWDFLAPWQGRLLSTNPRSNEDLLFSINKIFKTKIKIRESGSIELATLIMQPDGKYIVIENKKGQFELFTVTQRYDEDFQKALYRGGLEHLGLEVEDKSNLWGLHYDCNEKDDLGNEYRSFIMESKTLNQDIPEITENGSRIVSLSKREIITSLQNEKWSTRHSKMVQLILERSQW